MRFFGSILIVSLALSAQTTRIPAGSDRDGKALTVVRQKFPEASESRRKGKCVPAERYSLIVGDAAPRSIVTVCQTDPADDDSYRWETTASVKRGLISIVRNGGSFAGIYRQVYQLSPWRAVSFDFCAVDGDGSWRVEAWDWTEMRGRYYEGDSKDGVLCSDDPKNLANYIIPLVTMDAAQFEKSGAGLGTCAMTLDASGKHGFVPWGAADARDPIEIKLLLTAQRTLIAQIIDPHRFTGKANSWINADHFEIWREGSQFGIPLDEGPVEVGAGKPAQLPQVRRWNVKMPDGRTAAMVRIELPPKTGMYDQGFKLIYSQSLDGHGQKRFISTSRGRRGADWETQHSVLEGNSAGLHVACGIANGMLDVTGAQHASLELRTGPLGWAAR
ncbi:MAG TPA: hypothetical protein VKU01_03750 [Bryobacteraceae bacterium]|nr:hypothetical protein [Bryobacteraceae bacterium]